MAERIVYVNGKFVPESQAVVSYRDRGFRHGDAAFDTLRTFRHQLFRLDEHLERLQRSLRYIRIDPGMDRPEMAAIMTELVDRNAPLLDADDDYWVTIRVSRGDDAPTRGSAPNPKPTVVVSCDPLPFGRFARFYTEGVTLVPSTIRRTPPQCLDPRAKLSNYLNQILADFEAHQVDPLARPLMLDIDGNVAESSGANFFLVRDGKILTADKEIVLGGISRQATIELAREIDIPVEETRLTLFDAYTADEAFLTGTSFCLMPVARIGPWEMTNVPGPVVQRLLGAWSEHVGLDVVAQAERMARTPVSA